MQEDKKENNSIEELYGTNHGDRKEEPITYDQKPNDEVTVQEKSEQEIKEDNKNKTKQTNDNTKEIIIDKDLINKIKDASSKDSHKKIQLVSLNQYRTRLLIIFISLILACSVFTFFLGFYYGRSKNKFPYPGGSNQVGKSFNEVLPEMISYLKQNYYKDLSDQEINANIINSIFGAANDRYTRIGLSSGASITPRAEGGFGITVSSYQSSASIIRGILVNSVNPGTQAYENILNNSKDALYPGDIIVGIKIDDKYYSFFDISTLSNDFGTIINPDILNGELEKYFIHLAMDQKNAHKEVIVYSPNRNEDLHLVKMTYRNYPTSDNKQTRYKILHPTGSADFFLPGIIDYKGCTLQSLNKKVAYLQISEFENETTPSEVEKALSVINKYLTSSDDELVIDLRNNPGGDSRALNAIIRQFIPKENDKSKQKILYAFIQNALKKDNSKIKKSFFYNDEGIAKPHPYKIKVLVNEYSASAAEVLAVVLKEFCPNTKIYGTKTFGKDLYQSVRTGLFACYEFPSGFNVRITEGKWGYTRTNNKNDIHYITEKNYEINPLEESPKNKQIANNLFSPRNINFNLTQDIAYDSVSKDNLMLVNFIRAYILENNTKLGYLTEQDINFIKNTKFFRYDMYIDQKIKMALDAILSQLGAPKLDDSAPVIRYHHFRHLIKYAYSNNLYDYFNFLDLNKALLDQKDKQLLECIYENQ